MHFLRIEEQAVELKYCERCGALWVRRVDSSRPLCKRCVEQVNAMPRSFAEHILGRISTVEAFSASREVRA